MYFVTVRRQQQPFTPVAATDLADAYSQLLSQAERFNLPVSGRWIQLGNLTVESLKLMVSEVWGAPIGHVKVTPEDDLPAPVRQLRDIIQHTNELREQLEGLRIERDQAIHRAVKTGISQAFLAEVTGVPASTIAKSYNEVEKASE